MTPAKSSGKFCPFLPFIPVSNPLQPQKQSLSPMACQECSCAMYDEAGKKCGLLHGVSVDFARKEIKVV